MRQTDETTQASSGRGIFLRKDRLAQRERTQTYVEKLFFSCGYFCLRCRFGIVARRFCSPAANGRPRKSSHFYGSRLGSLGSDFAGGSYRPQFLHAAKESDQGVSGRLDYEGSFNPPRFFCDHAHDPQPPAARHRTLRWQVSVLPQSDCNSAATRPDGEISFHVPA